MTEFTSKTGIWYAPDKDPNSVLDYSIDWSDWLGSDTIHSSTWTLPAGIIKDPVGQDSFTNTVTTIWLSGGTAGTTYTILNRIVTHGGRTADQTFKITCKEL